VIGKPLMADKSEMRLGASIVAPRGALREDARGCDAEDYPHDVHRHSPVIVSRTFENSAFACGGMCQTGQCSVASVNMLYEGGSARIGD
jgi:hypothetical protein